jgi:hypothetical protein
MVVDGFEVFGFNPKLINAGLRLERAGNISYQIFNKLRIVVRPFGDEFLV